MTNGQYYQFVAEVRPEQRVPACLPVEASSPRTHTHMRARPIDPLAS